MTTRNLFIAVCIFLCAILASLYWVIFAVQQNNPEILSSQIQNIDNIQIVFTEEERRWLAKNHTVHTRVGKAPPYSYFKEKPLGISSDYLDAIAHRAGFKVKYIADIPWPDALRRIEHREKLDLLPALTKTMARKKYLVFTQAYLTSPRVIYALEDSEHIASLEDLADKIVSVERGYIMEKKLSVEYPKIKLLVTDTSENALKHLALGKADAYIGNLTAGTHVIRSRGLNNIKIAAPAPFGELALAMGVRSDWPELASIINKVLTTFSHEEHVAIRDKSLAPIRYEYGISPADILKWFLGIICIPVSIIITISIWNRKLRKEISERKKAEEEIETLKGIIPICSYCKVIRNDEGAWEQLEVYLSHHSDAQFSHGICPECNVKERALLKNK